MSIRVLIRKKPDRRSYLMYYIDPITGNEVSKSSKTHLVREAERAASRWESELNTKGRGHSPDPPWERFRERFVSEHLLGLAPKSRKAFRTSLNAFERHIGKPRAISLIDSGLLSEFVGKLREEDKSASTIASYLQHLSSALSWAQKMGMIAYTHKCLLPRTKKRKLMRGRPITDDEFAEMLEAIPRVFEEERITAPLAEWERFLRSLWSSGLRVSEAIALSWDHGPLRVDLDGRRPRIIAEAEGHKSRSDDVIPITPEFYELLIATPKDERKGKVFKLGVRRRVVVDVLSMIGRKSGVIVNDKGKFATAHDLRRSFGTRWALRVHPMILQRIMRHKSIETTMRYYVALDADDVADELWKPLLPCPGPRPDNAPQNGHAKKRTPVNTGK